MSSLGPINRSHSSKMSSQSGCSTSNPSKPKRCAFVRMDPGDRLSRRRVLSCARPKGATPDAHIGGSHNSAKRFPSKRNTILRKPQALVRIKVRVHCGVVVEDVTWALRCNSPG